MGAPVVRLTKKVSQSASNGCIYSITNNQSTLGAATALLESLTALLKYLNFFSTTV